MILVKQIIKKTWISSLVEIDIPNRPRPIQWNRSQSPKFWFLRFLTPPPTPRGAGVGGGSKNLKNQNFRTSRLIPLNRAWLGVKFINFWQELWFLQGLGRFLTCLDRFRHDWKGLDMIRKLILTCLSNLSFLPGGFAPRTPQQKFDVLFFFFSKNGFLSHWNGYVS